MSDRERLWRCIREATCAYEAPDHIGEEQLRRIARALCGGIAPVCEDQEALGPLPDFVEQD